MKSLIIALGVLIAGSSASADTAIELLGPNALTYHVLIGDSFTPHKFANKISDDGRLIDNEEIGLSLVTTEDGIFRAATVFGGTDSIGYSMYGGMYEMGWAIGNWQIGAAVGAYVQDENPWIERNMFSFKATEIGTTDIVPVLGFVFNYKIQLNEKIYLNINNIISPIITNTVLSLGWNI